MQQSSEVPAQTAIVGWRPVKRVVMSTREGVIAVEPDQVFADQLAVDRLKRHGIALERVYGT
jgi:hypothetical protein